MKKLQGFVYIWMDKKHKRFYVGSHMGREDDGYICSSKTMRQAYERRPGDFKRRILERHTGDSLELLKKELVWLKMIRHEELDNKYYNKKKNAWGISREKISENSKRHWADPAARAEHVAGMKRGWTPERREARSEIAESIWARPGFRESMDRTASNLKAWSNPDVERRRASFRGKTAGRKMSPEVRVRMSESAKRRCTPEWSERHGEMMRAKRREKLGY